MDKLYVVQGEYEGGVCGAFTDKAAAERFKAACDESHYEDSIVVAITPDLPWQVTPVIGIEVTMMEGREPVTRSRAIVGARDPFATLQEFGTHRGMIYAGITCPTEAEAQAKVAELIAAKRAEIDKEKVDAPTPRP